MDFYQKVKNVKCLNHTNQLNVYEIAGPRETIKSSLALESDNLSSDPG